MRLLVLTTLIIYTLCGGCKDPAAVKKYEQELEAQQEAKKRDSLSVEHDTTEQKLNVKLLIGKWQLDIPELHDELRRNAKTKKDGDLLVADFNQRYSSIKMQFFDDNRWAGYFNDEIIKGMWGVSSDGASYYLQLSDDFIELHEVLALNKATLIELPVAQMRTSHIPVKQMVYTRL